MKTNQQTCLPYSVPSHLAYLVLPGLLILASAYACTGAIRIWTGGGGNGYWNTAANWGGTAPSQGDDLVFPAGAARLTNTNNYNGWGFNSITFSGSNYVIRGNPLILTNGISAQQPTGTNTFHPQITLGKPQTIECTATAATLVLGTGGLNLGTNNIVFNALGRIVASGVITGSGGVTKSGSGTLSYTATYNEYTGSTYVSRGVLELNCFNPDAALAGLLIIGDGTNSATVKLVQSYELPNNTLVFIYANGTLDLQNCSEDMGTLTLIGGTVTTGTGTLTLNGDILSLASTSTATISGYLNLGGYTRTVYVADSSLDPELVISAIISNGGITKTGSGNVRFSGANTYSGLTTIQGGCILLAHSKGLGNAAAGTVLNGGNLTILGVPVGSEPLTNNSPSSVLQSSGAALWEGVIMLNTNLHVQTLSGSTLRLAGQIIGSGGLTKDGSGTLRYEGLDSNIYTGQTVVTDGVLELYKTGLFLDAVAIGAGSLVIGDGLGPIPSVYVRLFGPNQIAKIPITINADGLLDLNNNNDDVGDVTFRGGTVTTGSGVLTIDGNLIVEDYSAPATVTGRLNFTGGQRTIYVADGGHFYDLILAANVSDSGGGLVFTNATPGASLIQLLGTNDFTGQTIIANVRVRAETPRALGATNGGTIVKTNATLWLYSTGITNEALTLYPGAELVAERNCTWAGQIALSSGKAIISPNLEGYSFTVLGQVSGNGGFTKRGAGDLVLACSSGNTYTGDTAVDTGTLVLRGGTGTIPGGTLTIGDSLGDRASVVVRLEANNQIALQTNIRIESSGLLDLNGYSQSLSGLLEILNGEVRTGTGILTLSSGSWVRAESTSRPSGAIYGQLYLGGGTETRRFEMLPGNVSPALQIYASVSGQAGVELYKTGLGALELLASNSFNGHLRIAQGSVFIENDCALGTTNGATTVSNGASLILAAVAVGAEPLTLQGSGAGSYGALWSGNGMIASWAGPITLAADTVIGVVGTNGQLTLSGPIIGPGGFTKTGGGRLQLTGSTANSYGGITRVQEGTLELGKGSGALNGAIPGRLEINTGTVRLLGSTQIANTSDVVLGAGGVLDLNNMAEAFDELSGSGTVQLGNRYLNLGVDNGSSIFTGIITGSGALTKLGTGTIRLTANNPYTGTTTVRDGVLIIDGVQRASSVTVESGATLRGIGWIGPLTVYGRVQPGSPSQVGAGSLITSNVTFSSSGRFVSTIWSDGADQLSVDGSVELGGATLELSRQGAPWLGQNFCLIENDAKDAVVGTFAGLPEGATVVVDGLQFRLSYMGGSTNDVVLTFTNAPLGIAGVQIGWGDGDDALEPGECALLSVQLTNRTGGTVRNISASLLPGLPGSSYAPIDALWLVHHESMYPEIPAGGTAVNIDPLQLWLGTWWSAGRDVPLSMQLVTATNGSFILPLRLPTSASGGGKVGGPCELCSSDFQIAAVLSPNAPVQVGQLTNSATSGCELPMICPGVRDLVSRCYNAYWFINGESNACISVRLTGPQWGNSLLFSAAYLDEFDPANICAHFIGTAGHNGNAKYSFNVGPCRRFVVVVSQSQTNPLPDAIVYTLEVTGGSCRPWLGLERVSAGGVAVKWTSAAVEYRLEATPVLPPIHFNPVTNLPVVVDGQCVVTNQAVNGVQFYRLSGD